MENHTKYQESVYLRSADGSALWVNLFIASTLSWPERGFTVTQTTDFPRGQSSRLVIDGSGPLTLRLRVPAWISKGYLVSVNGADQKVSANPGTYVTLQREWRPGDTVEIAIPFRLRVERALDDPSIQSLFYGPVLLTAMSGPIGDPPDRRFLKLSFYRHLKRDGDLARAVMAGASPNHFTTGAGTGAGIALRPLYVADTQPYHTYFRRDEPSVVFGVINSGVPNDGIKDDEGLTVLDRIWDKAPFADHGQFVRHVEEVTGQWLDAGRHTREQCQAILAAAARAEEELRP